MHREVDYLKDYYFWRTELGFFTNYRIVAEYSKGLSIEKHFKSTKDWIRDHAEFAMDISFNYNFNLGDYISLLDSIKLGDVVEFVDDQSLDDIPKLLNKYQNEKFTFGEMKPLWRLKIVNEKYAVFFCDRVSLDDIVWKNFYTEMFEQSKDAPLRRSGIFNKASNDLSNYVFTPEPVALLKTSGPLFYAIYNLITELTPRYVPYLMNCYFDHNPYAQQLQYVTIP